MLNKNSKSSREFDVAVIGGGPAGMMAAGRAAELGARVVLLEKNAKLGRKLLITGGGRCNITNAEFNTRHLIEKYGPKGKALFGAFSRFGVEDTINFFTHRGLPIKVEAEKRAFPVTDKAEDVWQVMKDYLQQGQVEIVYDTAVSGLHRQGTNITAVMIGKKEIRAKKYIIATGGKSRPETGSTGDGFQWLSKLGHTIEESNVALVPIKIKESWPKDVQGLSIDLAALTVLQDGIIQAVQRGKLLFTHFGISGPLALNMSHVAISLHKHGVVRLNLDLRPETDSVDLDKQIRSLVRTDLNKQLKNILSSIISPRLVKTILSQARIDPEKQGNALTKEERQLLVQHIKSLPMTVAGFLGEEKAVVTSGGVSLKEVDFKTMQSKKFTNLYLAGDILNFDRPSGGYSLQICWTTGYLAGENSVV
ncbi:MAG: NAD(P)/FAD-dependent oxidoreductase [Candidatus Komeilibacteria bacterium]|nr:NAD(P)/FAD-dependent oxidoreductase [Candidatus Komeilibacteria bacterium]